ncbi:MAG TPA: BON domain-containing protein [Thermomicrobiales bacterium]|nr:BON domain-containing protein [Thermomicrobiales bacterium]
MIDNDRRLGDRWLGGFARGAADARRWRRGSDIPAGGWSERWDAGDSATGYWNEPWRPAHYGAGFGNEPRNGTMDLPAAWGWGYGRGGGQYAGVGPKGYKRSDERIDDDVNARLTWSPDLDPSDITVSVADGEVTLSGSVDSRWQKRLAGDIADDVPGVRDVFNQIKIRQNAPEAKT